MPPRLARSVKRLRTGRPLSQKSQARNGVHGIGAGGAVSRPASQGIGLLGHSRTSSRKEGEKTEQGISRCQIMPGLDPGCAFRLANPCVFERRTVVHVVRRGALVEALGFAAMLLSLGSGLFVSR